MADDLEEIPPERLVRFTLDPNNPPRMTEEQRARFDAMTDDDIDYSDIPDQGGRTDWIRPGITLYVDTDIARYFRRESDFVLDSARINQVLREYIAAHPKAS